MLRVKGEARLLGQTRDFTMRAYSFFRPKCPRNKSRFLLLSSKGVVKTRHAAKVKRKSTQGQRAARLTVAKFSCFKPAPQDFSAPGHENETFDMLRSRVRIIYSLQSTLNPVELQNPARGKT
jgi:hypothetical protein